MEHEEQIAAAKRIEEAHLVNLTEESKKCEVQVAQEIRSAAAVGGLGGRLYQKCVHIRFDALRSVVDGMVGERKRLIASVPMLASRAELAELSDRLEKIIDCGADEIFAAQAKQRDALPDVLSAEILSMRLQMKEKAKRDLAILEGNALLSRTASPPGAITITAGAGSIISVGNTAHSIVSTLNQGDGSSELKHLLRELAESIEKSDELTKEKQKDALESLEFVVGQVTLEPEKRAKPSVILGVWNNVAQVVAFCANLAQLTLAAAPLLTQHISIH